MLNLVLEEGRAGAKFLGRHISWAGERGFHVSGLFVKNGTFSGFCSEFFLCQRTKNGTRTRVLYQIITGRRFSLILPSGLRIITDAPGSETLHSYRQSDFKIQHKYFFFDST